MVLVAMCLMLWGRMAVIMGQADLVDREAILAVKASTMASDQVLMEAIQVAQAVIIQVNLDSQKWDRIALTNWVEMRQLLDASFSILQELVAFQEVSQAMVAIQVRALIQVAIIQAAIIQAAMAASIQAADVSI